MAITITTSAKVTIGSVLRSSNLTACPFGGSKLFMRWHFPVFSYRILCQKTSLANFKLPRSRACLSPQLLYGPYEHLFYEAFSHPQARAPRPRKPQSLLARLICSLSCHSLAAPVRFHHPG